MGRLTGRAGSWPAASASARIPCNGFWRKPMSVRIDLTPPQHAAVFCADEKTAIQALDRLDPAAVVARTAGAARL
jgi:hypothetical protein